MSLKEELIELRLSTGMNKAQFARYFGIPYRTYQEWELGGRRVPEYLLRLMAYKIEVRRVLFRSYKIEVEKLGKERGET